MEELILKKRIFGGFDRGQVIDCINTLMKECDSSVTLDDIDSTKAKLAELEKQLSETDSQIQKMYEKRETSPELIDIRMTAEQIENALNNADGSVEQLLNQLDEINMKINTLEDSVEIISNRFDDTLENKPKKQTVKKSAPKKKKAKNEVVQKNPDQLQRDKMLEETTERLKQLKLEKEQAKARKKK